MRGIPRSRVWFGVEKITEARSVGVAAIRELEISRSITFCFFWGESCRRDDIVRWS